MSIPILVADSNREFGILIRQALEESGRFEVSVASGGAEAVAIAKDLDFRLAIIDFALPDLEGERIVEQLRALQPGLAVIAIPVEEDDSFETTHRAGVDGILTKPFYLPNLPNIVEDALSRRLDFHRPPTGPLRPQAAPPIQTEEPGPNEPPEGEQTAESYLPFSSPPPWLTDEGRAGDYLAQLLSETAAEAALLIRHREMIAFAGEVPRSQLQELTAQAADSWAEEGRRGAVARFVHLPGSVEDFLLYATSVIADLVLSLVFQADVPFGTIRRQAETTADALVNVDPADRQAQVDQTSSATDRTQPVSPVTEEDPLSSVEHMPEQVVASSEPSQPDGASAQSPLPEDWIPQRDQPSPGERLLDELASLSLPDPDPEIGERQMALAEPIHASRGTPDLPLDWLPMITHSRRHLPFLDDPAPPDSQTCSPAPSDSSPAEPQPPEPLADKPPTLPPEQAAADAPTDVKAPAHAPSVDAEDDQRLPFTMVFAPRFPEHRLAGPLVDNLSQWIHRLCLAWDWKAERVVASDDALLVEVKIPADIAPASAAQDLVDHLSERIFEAFPHLEPGFPSGGFWASAHMLVPGRTTSTEEVEAFIAQLRRKQGLTP